MLNDLKIDKNENITIHFFNVEFKRRSKNHLLVPQSERKTPSEVPIK